MAVLVALFFVASIVLIILGIISAIRKKPKTRLTFISAGVCFVLMFVFAFASGSKSDENTVAGPENTVSADESVGTVANVENSGAAKVEDASKADADAKAKADADAKAKADADAKAKADADAKAKADADAKAKADREAALASMVKTVDEVEGITWYQDKSAPKYINENGIYAYFGIQNDSVSGLYLKIQYAGQDWLFIKNYVFNIDGMKFEIDPGLMGAESDMSTDLNNPGVWEYHDELLDSKQIEKLQQIIASQKTIMRLEGNQRNKDVVLSAEQKSSLKRTLDAYIAAGGEI
ncbi:hypothetical protein [Paenibacillus sp. NFR01]|uniref:hypothetical protein n=1 Tax=Paenibacillus sp. NFR01 TaxID=1566279 RepID=UPI000B8401E4|nr:hypothetical protein [Paenibacillus sp. NFR01]